MKIAIIGAGNMGGAIARGLAKSQLVAASDLCVSDPSTVTLDKLHQEFPDIALTQHNGEAAAGADVVVLAVKPWLAESVLGGLELKKEQLLISIVAGVDFARLSQIVGRDDQPICRMIPNTAIRLGESTTLIACNAPAKPFEPQVVELFGSMGRVFVLAEHQMAAATAMTSCGIAYALKYIQAAMQAGIELGIYPQDGMQMVAQSVKGAAALILEGNTHPAVEIDKVCTPGGITIKGVNELEHSGFASALIKAIKSSC